MDQTPTENESLTPKTEQEKEYERLESIGELLIESSALIELLHSHQQAQRIDYELDFPSFLHPNTVYPSLEAFDQPEMITVKAGSAKVHGHLLDGSDEGMEYDGTAKTINYLELYLTQNHMTHTIQRNNDPEHEDEDYILLAPIVNPGSSESQHIPSHSFTQLEVNKLLMSLATGRADYAGLEHKDLLETSSFGFLIETLREKTLGDATTKGEYIFRDGDTELNFKKENQDVTFAFTYTDTYSDKTMSIEADTKTGITLKFYVFGGSLSAEVRPSTEQIEFFRKLIKKEVELILSDSLPVLESESISDDPEQIAIEHIAADDHLSFERLRREVDFALGEDSFDSPDSSAA